MLASALAALAFTAAPATGQSAADILSDAMDRHEARLAGVDNVTIRQQVMGTTTTMYMVKEMVDGHPVLRPVEGQVAGADFDLDDDMYDIWASPQQFYVEMADHWELEGRGAVDGRDSWMLVLNDPGDLDWGEAPGQEGEFHPSRIELRLSVDDLVPLEMRMEGEMEVEGGMRPVSLRMLFSDYREIDGYLHPFLTTMETQMPTDEMSEEELDEARAQLEEVRRQLEQAPAAQREMIERMMGDQIQMLENLVAGEGITMEMRVTDLQVNAGPPQG